MKLVRVLFAEEQGVRLWADLRKRIWIASQMENPGCNSDEIVADIQRRWVNVPNTVAIWAGVDDQNNILGHVVAWVEVAWAQPQIFVFQLISDPHTGALMALKDEFLTAMSEWIDSLNTLYERGNVAHRINQSFRFNTAHAEAFERIFAGRCATQYSVVEIDVSPSEPLSKEIH